MLAATTFQEVLVQGTYATPTKEVFPCFKQQSIPSVFMGQPFPPPEST